MRRRDRTLAALAVWPALVAVCAAITFQAHGGWVTAVVFVWLIPGAVVIAAVMRAVARREPTGEHPTVDVENP